MVVDRLDSLKRATFRKVAVITPHESEIAKCILKTNIGRGRKSQIAAKSVMRDCTNQVEKAIIITYAYVSEMSLPKSICIYATLFIELSTPAI